MAGSLKPQPRRSYGSGAVFQRCERKRGCPDRIPGPDGNLIRPPHDCKGIWVGRVEVGWDQNGKRKTAPVYASTKAACERKLRDLKNDIDQHGAPTTSRRTTVKEWAQTYLDMIVVQKRPNAYRGDATAIKVWIVPTLGQKRLCDLTPADVRAVENAQRAKGRSSSTMLRTRVTLNDMLTRALLEGHAIKPAVFKVKRPSVAVNDRDAMTLDQAVAVIAEAGKLPHGSRYLVAFFQGGRQAEDLGMEWDRAGLADVDAGYFDRSWQIQHLPYNMPRDRKSGFRIPDGYEVRQIKNAAHWTRPKTSAGVRITPAVEPVRLALLAWREQSKDQPNPHGLIWPMPDGRPRNSKTDDAEWYSLQDAASVRHPSGRYFTIHEARHTTVTLLMQLGVSDDDIEAIVGHSSKAATKGYKHVSDVSTRKALSKLATVLQLPPVADD